MPSITIENNILDPPEIFKLIISMDYTVMDIKYKIHELKRIPFEDLYLTLDYKQLEESKEISHYRIENGSVI